MGGCGRREEPDGQGLGGAWRENEGLGRQGRGGGQGGEMRGGAWIFQGGLVLNVFFFFFSSRFFFR